MFDGEREIEDSLKDIEKNRIKKFMQQNNPRIYGVSSDGNEDKTIINKAVFTSCKQNDDCPPWSLKAKKITHDKVKQNILSNHAILNLYDFPVCSFPHLYNPEPSVKRRHSLVKPRLNSSSSVGTPINILYCEVI